MSYKCGECNFSTYAERFAKIHTKLHSSLDEVFKCKICGYLTRKKI